MVVDAFEQVTWKERRGVQRVGCLKKDFSGGIISGGPEDVTV